MFGRRKFLKFLGLGGVAAAVPASVAIPTARFVPAPGLTPIDVPFGYVMQFADADGSAHGFIRLIHKIFDGESWVVLDSIEGYEVLDRSYEFYRQTPAEGHQT